MSIGSGYRTNSQQQELYNKWLATRKNKAAKPGFSWHNFACAVDVTIFRADGSYDDGKKGDSNYTGRARSAFKSVRMQNGIPNDMGHFYPSEFPKYPPKAVRIGKKSVTKYANERGVST